MLSRIKEEHLQAIPVPVESRTLRDELSSARSHVLELISRHLVAFGDRFPAETCQNGVYPLTENVEWTTSFWNVPRDGGKTRALVWPAHRRA